MKLTREQHATVREIRHSEDGFSALVRIAGLDPCRDFRYANLSGVDFGSADLRGYDFTGADLTGADFRRARWEGAILRDADMSGALWPAADPPRTEDFWKLYELPQLRPYQSDIIETITQRLFSRETRVLVCMPPGTGRHTTAEHLLARLASSRKYGLKRALYLCGNLALREQIFERLKVVFGADASLARQHPKSYIGDSPARIQVANVQQLLSGGGRTLDFQAGDRSEAIQQFALGPSGYFSHIIIDECMDLPGAYFGRAEQESPKLIQIGFTVAHIEVLSSSDFGELISAKGHGRLVGYFGSPTYAYSLRRAIDEGYLAKWEILPLYNDVEAGLSKGEIGKHLNTKSAASGEWSVRFKRICRHLFSNFLATGGPEQKTVVFCANTDQAAAIAHEMNGLYLDWCKQTRAPCEGKYAFRFSGVEREGTALQEFRRRDSILSVATTVQLLAAGFDLPFVRNVVLLQRRRSDTSVIQMIGAALRPDPEGQKLVRVYDYVGATASFSAEMGGHHTS